MKKPWLYILLSVLIGLIICVWLFIRFISVLGGGTHGSLKGYQYDVPKDRLEKAVMAVIKSNSGSIYRDTNNVNIIIDNTNGKNDTTIDNYYNDGKNYVTIKIKVTGGENEYTFRYYGDEQNWKASSISEIFICYAYDKSGKGGSEGNGNVDDELKQKLTAVFEKEFIDKIDKELNLSHLEEN